MFSCTGKFFTDEYGRARMFRGFNYVYKGAAVDPDGVTRYKFDISDDEIAFMAEKGVNVVRLGLTWAGVEPEAGKINYEYLDGFKTALKKFTDSGISVFVDFHQDLYSCFGHCQGDGAPEFAVARPKIRKPDKTYVIWAENYFFNPSVLKSFDNFWTAGSFEQEHFLFALEKTAEYLGDCDILAYDVLNEPFPGSPALKVAARLIKNGAETFLFSRYVDRARAVCDLLAKDIFKMLSVADDSRVMSSVVCPATDIIQKFDREKYIPFLQKAEKALRRGGYDGIIFTENCYFSNLGIPNGLKKISDRAAFAPHGYDITVDTPLTNTASPCRVDFIFDEHKRAQDRMDLPVLVGEWGGMVNGADDYPALTHLVEKFESNYWSFAYWHWFRGLYDSKIGRIMTKSYPVAVAGKPKRYENKNGRLALSYTGDGTAAAPTEIFLAKKPAKVYSTAPYKIEGNRLYADARDGECVIIIEE